MKMTDKQVVTETPGRRWADIVIAMLSVNNYPLTKTFALAPRLEAAGLFDPRNLIRWPTDEIARRLGDAGYDRGPVLTEMFSRRLASLGRLGANLERNELVLAGGDKKTVETLLAGVHGVGPLVLSHFFLLRGDQSNAK